MNRRWELRWTYGNAKEGRSQICHNCTRLVCGDKLMPVPNTLKHMRSVYNLEKFCRLNMTRHCSLSCLWNILWFGQTDCMWVLKEKNNKKIKLFLCGFGIFTTWNQMFRALKLEFSYLISHTQLCNVLQATRLKTSFALLPLATTPCRLTPSICLIYCCNFNFFVKGPKPEVKTDQLHTSAQLQWFDIP